MPLQLNFLEKIGINCLNQGPAPMVDLLGMLSFKAVTAALRLGVFEAIGDDRKNNTDVAAITGSDTAGISLLLDALENLGYLKHRRGQYSNTRSTKKWLLAGSKHTIADLFHHFNDMSSRWDYLDDSIRAGHPPELGWEWLDRQPGRWRNYHAGLKSTARLIFPELSRKINIPRNASKILDLGGSHGQYSVEFCIRYPNLTGIVFDWAPAEKTAVETINSCGLSDRISFKAGDFVKDPIGSGYDVILLFNIIRIFRPDGLKALLKKIYAALSKDGMIVIMDHLGHRAGSRFMRANAYLILLEIYNSTVGKTHHRTDVSSWLKETGFSSIRDHSLTRSPGLGVITAMKR